MKTFRQFLNEAVLNGGVVTQTPGAIRSLPLAQGLVSTIKSGLEGTGLDWHSYSGGQPPAGRGGKRIGSHRHDNGRASDGYFKDAATGKVLDGANADDRGRIAQALGKLRQAGIQGIGWGPGYMGTRNFHIDIVSPEIWGEGGRSANAHNWVKAAAGGNVAPPSGGGREENEPPRGPDEPEGDAQEEIGGAAGDEETNELESQDIGSFSGLKKAIDSVVDTFTSYGKEL